MTNISEIYASVPAVRKWVLTVSQAAGQDAFVFQNLTVTPNTRYEVSARVNARAMRRPAAGGRNGRGLLVWDAQDGRVYTAR